MEKTSSIAPGRSPSEGLVTTNKTSNQNQTQFQRPGLPQLTKTPSMTTLESQHSRHSSTTSSINPSPLASRDPSPHRPTGRPTVSKPTTSAVGTRSRKNSIQDLSPSRTPKSAIPVLPAGARTLSAASTPTLLPGAQPAVVKPDGPQKAALNTDQPAPKDNPRWPVSPRLRSPPPQLGKPGVLSMRRGDSDMPRLALQRATPSPQCESAATMSESEADDSQSGVRTPALGSGSTLETVQEVSQPNSPGHIDATLRLVNEKLSSEASRPSDTMEAVENRTLRVKPNLPVVESGSDSGSVRAETRRSAPSAVSPSMIRQSSAMSSKQGKTKSLGEGSAQNMLVETETVTSIPQIALAPGTGAQSGNGTLKAKPSTETIKPKKDKKKSTRKQSAVATGTASSKADIFEAKVASAVDEADDSDSEETFVYDSNPPDGGDRPRRFHSRTPSATSMVSQAERNQMRSIHSVMDPGPPVTMKKNMKFVNTFNSNGADSLTGIDDDGKGTGRSNPGSGRGTARHHHHIGRWGRNGGNSHPSLFDNESPFPHAARSKLQGNASRQSSGPPSPRFNSGRGALSNGKRSTIQMSSSYDMDDTTGADDERTPLIASTVRSTRSVRGRRNPATMRSLESQAFRQKPSYLNRFAACLVVTMMLLLVITGAIGFMFATSQPLTDIELVAVRNVLASEPELMFDLTVKAHNPNIVVVTIDQANLEIFAKSEHAGTDSDWWKMPNGPKTPGHGDVDEGKDSDVHVQDDPPDDPPDDDSAPNMRLGTITEFDSPLSFEGSFFNKGVSSSTGEVRLHLPGNHSAGGSERWSRIIQDEFDLIVKGVVRYSLPLSQRVRSAPISGRTSVKPNSANDPIFHPNSTEPAGSAKRTILSARWRNKNH